MGIEESKTTRQTSPSGEGERIAQRGYVPQYDLAARVTYAALARNELRWLGLADRGAGAFDDAVLGLADRIAAYQLKTSRDAARFSIRTVLLGAQKLLWRFLDARRRLEADFPGTLVETIYACDDYPRTDDDISGNAKLGVSSADFLRVHAERRLSWSLDDWRHSPHGPFINELVAASGWGESEFEAAWRHTRFETAGGGRALGLAAASPRDARRLAQLAAELPRLVVDPSDKDRWTVQELLRRLGWHDLFKLRHSHAFPIDALHEANVATEQALQSALSTVDRGYVSLIGPPGTGKSTLLSTGLLPTASAIVVRYLAYVPGEGHGLGRGEAHDFLHDLVASFKQHGFGSSLFTGEDLSELRHQLEIMFAEASKIYRERGLRTVVVVDGLDHVSREERPERSFLNELPLPQTVPEGVVIILGTQRLDLADIPPAVADQAREATRCVHVSPLTRAVIARLADAAGVPHDVNREVLFARTEGHPLSARYAIGALILAKSEEARAVWLRDGPAYEGDVEVFYRSAWRNLEHNLEARRVMSYVALAESPLHPNRLEELTDSQSVETAWMAAHHLLALDPRNAWSVFHNSFRLFLRARASERFGRFDSDLLRERYHEMAMMAADAPADDPQRWLELRYRARAEDHHSVLKLARPERFREQFIAGRNPKDLVDDIGLALTATRELRDPNACVELILTHHELSHRCSAIGDKVLQALIDLGDLNAAEGLLGAQNGTLSSDIGYRLVDAYFEDGDNVAARRVFEALEPIDVLLGEKDLGQITDHELTDWAKRVLAFRNPAQFVASLTRLRV